MEDNNLTPKCLSIRGKKIVVVDDHQYVLLAWGQLSQQSKNPLTLVSIDYHPDTNPPFWLYAYQKAIAINPDKEAVLVPGFQKKILATLNPQDLKTVEAAMKNMRNDEHINTAMELGYLTEYHMINCMEKHRYSRGHHYLVPESCFGSLEDRMFEESGFSMKAVIPDSIILDIDLDYFLGLKNFALDLNEHVVFKALVNQAQMITIARSESYFNYLKKEACTIAECENQLLKLLSRVLLY
ncbi:hypothetical protein GH808_10750 [Acetobacterium fimetarium]|uniref:Uncharacterized protein n=1 Tax=Acetobacterium fimetarium TaxID=52691 RepID=A0ABR6WWQ5_9FIRM|nr:UPF0489 family protein [Acetobacterium fimetarium]MBC3804911.1 hypothetical protein [Acetobacterium fimetarium]